MIYFRSIQPGKNYFKIPNYIGYYLQKCSKSTAGVNSTSSSSSSSSSSSDSDDPNVQDNKNKNEEKLKKLNELLMKLVEV